MNDSKTSINNAIQQFVNRTGCILILNPRADINCGDVFMDTAEQRERIGSLDVLLKPKEQKFGNFDIKKILPEPIGDSQLIANFKDISNTIFL